MRRRSARPEDIIQRAVMDHLRSRAMPRTFAFHVPNGGKRKPIEAAIMKGLGVRAGVPDIIIIKDGQTFGLELKAESGRVSDNQTETMKAMAAAGCKVDVVFGLTAALRWLEGNGILRGVAA